MLKVIRRFFEKRGVLEVSTPSLGRRTVTDPHIQSMHLILDSQTFFLQTSPEFAMKRLLAGGSGPIYQICQAFRDGESGSLHNPEFTMLEWYQPGYDLEQLMGELAVLMCQLCDGFDLEFEEIKASSYRVIFEKCFAVNPHKVSTERLLEIASDRLPGMMAHLSHSDEGVIDDIRDAMFASCIENFVPAPHFVTGFPASQAALANVARVADDEVALRFELYWQGIEIANGYDELTDTRELERRISRDKRIRKARNLPLIESDERLFAAMKEMKPCAGVAVGLDRLLMVLTANATLQDVMSFTIDDC